MRLNRIPGGIPSALASASIKNLGVAFCISPGVANPRLYSRMSRHLRTIFTQLTLTKSAAKLIDSDGIAFGRCKVRFANGDTKELTLLIDKSIVHFLEPLKYLSIIHNGKTKMVTFLGFRSLFNNGEWKDFNDCAPSGSTPNPEAIPIITENGLPLEHFSLVAESNKQPMHDEAGIDLDLLEQIRFVQDNSEPK